MENIKSFFKKIKSKRFKKEQIVLILPIALLFIVVMAMFIPVAKAGFNWIDDGRLVFESRELYAGFVNLDFAKIFNVLVEKRIGRFRPFYWIWNALVYRVAGDSAGLHFYFRFLLIFGTSFLIYKTVNLISKSKLAGIISSFLFILLPINTENWYRLGPTEPLLGFLLITSIYILFRYKNVAVASLFLLFAFFTKETAIALVPALIIYYLAKVIIGKKDKELQKYILYSLLLLAITLIVTFSIRRGYSESYVFNLQESYARFRVYINIARKRIPLLTIFIVTFIFRNGCTLLNKGIKKIKSSDINGLFFLTFFVSYLAVQSPWIWVLERYMLPVTIAATVFIGLELKKVFDLLESKSKVVASAAMVGLIATSIVYFSENIIRTITRGQRVSYGTQNLQEMFAYVSENSKEKGKVYLNFVENEATYEPKREMDRQLDLFYKRPDIEVKYLEERDLSANDYIVVNGSDLLFPYLDEDELLSLRSLQKVERIERTGNLLVVTTPINVIKQSIEKIVELIFKGKKLSAEGLYSFYQMKNCWSFYHIGI